MWVREVSATAPSKNRDNLGDEYGLSGRHVSECQDDKERYQRSYRGPDSEINKLAGEPIKPEEKPKPIKLSGELRAKYFTDTNPKEVEEIVDKALTAWFKISRPYHQHGHGNSLRQAIRSIKRYDRWRMNGRK